MSLPPGLHMHIINVKDLLFILGAKKHCHFFKCMIPWHSDSEKLTLCNVWAFGSVSPAVDSVQRALCGVLQCPQRLQQGEEPQLLSGPL